MLEGVFSRFPEGFGVVSACGEKVFLGLRKLGFVKEPFSVIIIVYLLDRDRDTGGQRGEYGQEKEKNPGEELARYAQ